MTGTMGYRYTVREVGEDSDLSAGTVVAWAENFDRAMHYARVYAQDGRVTLWDHGERIGSFAPRQPAAARSEER